MKNKGVLYSSMIPDDLEHIFRFYLPINRRYAFDTINYIEKQLLLLTDFNNLGKKVYNSKLSPNLNVLIIKNYLIFYEVINENIFVHRILHGKQDYESLLF